ncbi:MAG TPA: glycosyltransferase family 2 protein [Pirellulales bacterium]|nr:glycosyltransferase family 2 protein [Pirellulales bacterium]
MLHQKKIIVVLPAYKAARTLKQTYAEIPLDLVDELVLVDDASTDETSQLARELGMHVFVHQENLGYGANQKTCYREALALGADVVVMLHPDYQYEPRLISAMAGMIASGVYDVVLGSRVLGGTALRGGMPLYKYVFNRLLTFFQNIMLGAKLSEYHTGYRAFSRKVLTSLPLLANSDDFVFDNQMISQAIAFGFNVGEVSCPTKYFAEASSISFRRSVVYGLGVLNTSVAYRLWKWGLTKSRLFGHSPTTRLQVDYYRVEPSRSMSDPCPAVQQVVLNPAAEVPSESPTQRSSSRAAPVDAGSSVG